MALTTDAVKRETTSSGTSVVGKDEHGKGFYKPKEEPKPEPKPAKKKIEAPKEEETKEE